MTHFKNFAFLLLLFAIVSCSDKITNPDTNTTGIFPLKVGNTWNFMVSYFDGTKRDTTNYTIKITGDTIIDGTIFYSDGSEIMVNKSDGLYSYKNGKFLLLYKFPAEIGDLMPSYIDTNKLVVVSVDDIVTTKAGTFKCIKYQMISVKEAKGAPNYNYYSFEWFICPGVGIVKEIKIEEDSHSSRKDQAELQSYILK